MVAGWMVLVLAAATPQQSVQLKEYLRDPIGLYDRAEDLIRKAPKRELPKPPVLAGVAPDDFFSVQLKGETVLLRSSDVLVEAAPAIVCKPMAQVSRSASELVAGSDVGLAHNLTTTAVPCIAAKP